MSIEYLLLNNTSGTAEHYEKTSGDSRLYFGATEQTIHYLLWVMPGQLSGQ